MAENKNEQQSGIKDQRDPAGAPTQEHSSEAPKTEKAGQPMPGPGAPLLKVSGGKVIEIPMQDVTAGGDAKSEAEKTPEAPAQDGPATEEKKEVRNSPGKGKKSAPKAEKSAATKGKTAQDKTSQSGKKPKKAAPAPKEQAAPEEPEQPPAPRDASRAEKEEIVYLNLSDLFPFKDHPFGVRDDAEMQGLVESVKAGGVNQPALVRPREDGGYEIIAGHRRQRASELAGFVNMPCIVRNMTDDEAILAMTDDNLRHREQILPMEKAKSLKMQVEAIKHQGARPGEDDKDAGKRSTQIVGERNGINYKQVQRYIRLTELVPDLQKMVDEKKISFTPAVEMSFIRPKNQRYIAVSIEGQQSSPSVAQAKRMRELDKDGKLTSDIIDGILSEEKKEVDHVIITTDELNKYFGKEFTPRQMKDQIIALLDDWKEKQPPELAKPDKTADKEH